MRHLFSVLFLIIALCIGQAVHAQISPQDPLSAEDAEAFLLLIEDNDKIERGRSSQNHRRMKKIRKQLKLLINKYPNNGRLYHQMARYQLKSGASSAASWRHYQKQEIAAELTTRQGVEVDPKLDQNYILRGHIFELLGYDIDASIALRQAEALGSTDPWLYFNFARVYESQAKDIWAASKQQFGEPNTRLYQETQQKAINAYKQVYQTVPPTEKIWLRATDDLVRLTRYYLQDDFLAQLHEKRLAAYPKNSYIIADYARHRLCIHKDIEGAIKFANQSLALNPDQIEGKKWLAASLYWQWAKTVDVGNPQASQAKFEHAFQLYDQPRQLAKEARCNYLSVIGGMIDMVDAQMILDTKLEHRQWRFYVKQFVDYIDVMLNILFIIAAIIAFHIYPYFVKNIVEKETHKIDGRYRLSTNTLTKSTVILYLGVFIWLWYCAYTSHPSNEYFTYTVSLVFTCFVIWWVYRVFCISIAYDDEYLYHKTPFTSEKSLAWNTLSEIKGPSFQYFTLIFDAKDKPVRLYGSELG